MDQVGFDGGGADVELFANFTITITTCHKLQDINLTRTEIFFGRRTHTCHQARSYSRGQHRFAPGCSTNSTKQLFTRRVFQQIAGCARFDGTHDIGEGPILPDEERAKRYVLSECMTCGCCLEACPQFSKDNNFLGAATFAQVRLFNAHPTGKFDQEQRLDAVMGEGGIADCGNAQVCVEVCPKHIPLTESIADVGRQTTLQILKNLFFK